MTTSEKVAYLKGLAEGMGFENAGQEKLMSVIIDILEDLSLDMADTRSSVKELSDGVDELADDLTALEDEFYDTVYGEYEDDEDDEDDDEDEEVFYTVTCAKCGTVLTVDEDIMDKGVIDCPECGAVIDFSIAKIQPSEPEGEKSDELPF